MELSVVKPGNKAAGTVAVSEANFAREYNEALVHQVVTAYLSGARQGTRAQKTRSEVAGGGKKPVQRRATVAVPPRPDQAHGADRQGVLAKVAAINARAAHV